LDLSRKAARYRAEVDAAIARVLDRGRFILGPEVEAFETEVAAAFGARFAVGVGNGTEALELILRARGIGGGAEVILPAITSPFTALAVLAAGATAVVADVDPDTLLIDPESVAQARDGRTRAVMPVHLYGCRVPQDTMEILDASGLDIIQDAAQAHGAALQFDHPAAFSFYPTKNLGAFGDGGAVLTNDEKLAVRLRRLRNGGQGH
jgi:dTDP-4-amino-4,6-dideoxygalactose transaminase